MATLGAPVSFDPFTATPLDLALDAEGVKGPLADLARSIYMQESGGGRNTKTSNAGARGGMQIIPTTFDSVKDKDWDIDNPVQNARGGVRYLQKLYDQSGGDAALTAAGYYGGPRGMEKAKRGIAVSDPKNPKAPNTLQYAQQVVGRLGNAVTDAVMPSAHAGVRPPLPFTPEQLAMAQPPKAAAKATVTLGEPVDFNPFAQVEAQAKAQAEEDSKENKARRVRQLSVPILGPTLAAIDVDPKTLAKSAVGGMADIGGAILKGGEWVGNKLGNGNVNSMSSLVTGKPDYKNSTWTKLFGTTPPLADLHQAREDFHKANEEGPDGTAYKVGREATKIAATLPVGGIVAKPLAMAGESAWLASQAPKVAPWLTKLAEATKSGGFTLGKAPTAAEVAAIKALPTAQKAALIAGNTATRVGGGALGAGAQAAAAGDDAGTAAMIGAALPVPLRAAGKGLSAGATAARDLLSTPQGAKDAAKIAQIAGFKTPQEIDAAMAALKGGQQGPQVVQDVAKTVPQVFDQNVGLAQLGRSLRNAGDSSLLEVETAQDLARKAALQRIAQVNAQKAAERQAIEHGMNPADVRGVAPVYETLPEARAAFGRVAEPNIRAGEKGASEISNKLYGDLDDITRGSGMHLPLDDLAATQERFLGEGTVGTGKGAESVLAKAREIGTDTIPAITPEKAAKVAGGERTLIQAVRQMGIRNRDARGARHQLAGEINHVRSFAKGIVNNKQGKTIDEVAEAMHEAGYIPDDSPDTLLNFLRDDKLRHTLRAETLADDTGYRAAMEASQGAPPGDQIVEKVVPFKSVRTLRSSMYRMANEAEAMGHGQEAGALKTMIEDLDRQMEKVASGNGDQAGDRLTPEGMAAFRRAQDYYKSYMEKYHQGAVSSMFRKGASGNFMKEGDDLAPHFFSPRASASRDIADLTRVADQETLDALKHFAVTGQATKTTKSGLLSPSGMKNYLDSHSEPLKGLMSASEGYQMREVSNSALHADEVANLNRAVGSNTEQNRIATQLLGPGWIDSDAARWVAAKLPLGKMLKDRLGASLASREGSVERVGKLMADPDKMAEALAAYRVASARRPLGLPASNTVNPLMYRVIPMLGAGPAEQ